jgi:phenylacetate-CoA ligase
MPGLAPHYLLEVTRELHLDALTVKVECTQGLEHDASAREGVGRRLQNHIKEKIGVTAQICVATPGSIERSSGKAQRVIDRRAAR